MQTNPENREEFKSISDERSVFYSPLKSTFTPQSRAYNLKYGRLLTGLQGIRGFRLRQHAPPFLLRKLYQLSEIPLQYYTTLGKRRMGVFLGSRQKVHA